MPAAKPRHQYDYFSTHCADMTYYKCNIGLAQKMDTKGIKQVIEF